MKKILSGIVIGLLIVFFILLFLKTRHSIETKELISTTDKNVVNQVNNQNIPDEIKGSFIIPKKDQLIYSTSLKITTLGQLRSIQSVNFSSENSLLNQIIEKIELPRSGSITSYSSLANILSFIGGEDNSIYIVKDGNLKKILQGDGREIKELKKDYPIFEQVISHNGKYIAYLRSGGFDVSGDQSINVVNIDTGEIKTLIDIGSKIPSIERWGLSLKGWSIDDKYIYLNLTCGCEATPPDVAVVDITGKSSLRFMSPIEIAQDDGRLSPDSSLIVSIESDYDKTEQIFGGYMPIPPYRLIIQNLKTNKSDEYFRNSKNQIEYPIFSPNGKNIVFVNGRYTLSILDIESRKIKNIYSSTHIDNATQAPYISDIHWISNDYVLFNEFFIDSNRNRIDELKIINLNTGKEKVLATSSDSMEIIGFN